MEGDEGERTLIAAVEEKKMYCLQLIKRNQIKKCEIVEQL